MKTFFITTIAFLTFVITCRAQVPTQIVTVQGATTYVYVGSLNRSSGDSGNSQKIIVKILGGSWFADSDGETTYYISNRGGLTINETSLGGSASRLAFKSYQNGTNIDFYIVPSPSDYTSFAVTSYSFGYALSPQFVNITTQSTVPTSTDISSSVTISPVMITNATGNIGIGTASPDQKLAVNGTIHSKQVNVDLTGWPDYVFKPIYQLPSLAEVKTYMSHLLLKLKRTALTWVK